MQCPTCNEAMVPGTVAAKPSLLTALFSSGGQFKHLYFKRSSPNAKREMVLRSGTLAQACKCDLCGTVILIPRGRSGISASW